MTAVTSPYRDLHARGAATLMQQPLLSRLDLTPSSWSSSTLADFELLKREQAAAASLDDRLRTRTATHKVEQATHSSTPSLQKHVLRISQTGELQFVSQIRTINARSHHRCYQYPAP